MHMRSQSPYAHSGVVSLNVAVLKDSATNFRIAATSDLGEVVVAHTGLYGVHLHFQQTIGGGALDLSRFYVQDGARRQGYGALIMLVVRALAFGEEPLLKAAGAPSVKRMTATPRADAVSFYKKVGFSELCGTFTWFPKYPLDLSRLRLEYLSEGSPHHPVRKPTYKHARVSHERTHSWDLLGLRGLRGRTPPHFSAAASALG